MDERVLGVVLIVVIVVVVFALAIALTRIRAKDATPEAEWPTAPATVHGVKVKHHRSGTSSATAIVAFTTETGTTVTTEIDLGDDEEKWPQKDGSIRVRYHPKHRSTAEWVPPE